MGQFPHTVHELAQFLNLPERELCQFALRIDRSVRIKHELKPSGGIRVITVPFKNLKAILRILDRALLRQIPLPPFLFNLPGFSYVEMVRAHRNKKCLLTADIDDFFPSVKPHKIISHLAEAGFDSSVAKFITRLTTVNHSLPQGFPTSSTLAALVLWPIVVRLEGLTKNANLTVGIYADNLAISANYDIDKFQNLVKRIFRQNGFRLDKLKIMSRNDCKEIMGIVVGKGLRVKEQYLNDVRNEILLFSQNVNAVQMKNSELQRSIKGKIGYIGQVNPDQAMKLRSYADELGLKL